MRCGLIGGFRQDEIFFHKRVLKDEMQPAT
jgi:hypothetical protein